MPEGLKPLMAHRCHALGWDVTQQGVRDRGACSAVPMPMLLAHAFRTLLPFHTGGHQDLRFRSLLSNCRESNNASDIAD